MQHLKFYALLFLVFLFSANLAHAQNTVSKFQHIYGGPEQDLLKAIAVTTDGDYLLAGSTQSFGGSFTGDVDAYVVKTNQDGAVIWAHTYGKSAAEEMMSATVADDGTYYMIGNSIDSMTGITSINLLHIDREGTLLNNKLYNIYPNSWGNVIKNAGNGHFLIAGKTYNTMASDDVAYLMMADSAGNILWSKGYNTITGNADEIKAISNTADGGYLLTGDTYDIATQKYRVLVIKTTSDGEAEWIRTYAAAGDMHSFGGYEYGQGYIIGGEADDALEIANMMMMRLDDTGAVTWSKSYGGPAIDHSHAFLKLDSTFAIVGESKSFNNHNQYNGCVVEIMSSGIVRSAVFFGDSMHYESASCAATMANNTMVIGGSIMDPSMGYGMKDMYLMKTHDRRTGCMESAIHVDVNNISVSQDTFSGTDILSVLENGQLATTQTGSNDVQICLSIDTLGSTGVAEISTANKIAVYPNPSEGSFTLQAAGKYSVRVYNSTGMDVTSNFTIHTSAGNMIFSAVKTVPGIYLLQLQDAKGNMSSARVLLQ